MFLYAHRSTQLFYIERQCPVRRESFGGPSLRVVLEGAQDEFQHVSLIATQALTTNETWLALPPGEVVVFHRGQRIFHP